MYKVIAQELTGHGESQKFLGEIHKCRFCGATNPSDFGKRTNAHTFPEGLGNKSLFSVDECRACNAKFSLYEDALCKAVGPYLTLGGVKGKKGVRQTGRSKSNSVLRHESKQGNRHLHIEAGNVDDVYSSVSRNNETRTIRFPVRGDKFIPRYAYKALLKIALSLMPIDKLHLFQQHLACLQNSDQVPGEYPLQIGFSYASIGNAPPTLGGVILQRINDNLPAPYVIAIFQAGSVCFQIAIRSEEKDSYTPNVCKLDILWTSQLAKPEGGYLPIEYSKPMQFDWSELIPQLQPFDAFELKFNTGTTHGELKPVKRTTDQ